MAKKPTEQEKPEARIEAAATAFSEYTTALSQFRWAQQNGDLAPHADPETMAYYAAIAFAPDVVKEAFVLFGGTIPAPRRPR